jgi:hypothetical protein
MIPHLIGLGMRGVVLFLTAFGGILPCLFTLTCPQLIIPFSHHTFSQLLFFLSEAGAALRLPLTTPLPLSSDTELLGMATNKQTERVRTTRHGGFLMTV